MGDLIFVLHLCVSPKMQPYTSDMMMGNGTAPAKKPPPVKKKKKSITRKGSKVKEALGDGLEPVTDIENQTDENGKQEEVATKEEQLRRLSAVEDPEEDPLDDAAHDTTCAICLNDYGMFVCDDGLAKLVSLLTTNLSLDDVTEEGELVLTGTSCTHMFHKSCAFEWLAKHDHCPYCRMEMVTPEEMKCTAISVLGKSRVQSMSLWLPDAPPTPPVAATMDNADNGTTPNEGDTDESAAQVETEREAETEDIETGAAKVESSDDGEEITPDEDKSASLAESTNDGADTEEKESADDVEQGEMTVAEEQVPSPTLPSAGSAGYTEAVVVNESSEFATEVATSSHTAGDGAAKESGDGAAKESV